jgi:hypothetical protein
MLEAKQKSEAALHKLHQRISSKVAQQDTNPFVAAPTIEQLPLQLPALPAAAAAAAVAAAAVAVAGADGMPPEPANGSAGGPSTAAAGAAAAANGPSSSDQPLPASEAAGAGNGALGKAAAGSSAGAQLQQQQQQLRPLPFLQQRGQRQWVGSAAAAAAGDGELDEEDMLFESAAVLKAFSSVLPPELLAQHMERLQGGASSDEQKQQKQKQGLKDGEAEAADGIDGFDIIEEEEPSAMDVDAGGAAAGAAADPTQTWLSWDPQQQQQQQQGPAALLGPGGAAGAELLQFSFDPVASRKSIALRLAGGQRPLDAFAERSSSGRRDPAAAAAAAAGGTGVRQRRSKYDVADPRQQKAEGILNASPEAVYATTAEGRQGAVYGEMFGADMDEL